MAQPKRRWSKARTGLRRSTWKLEKPSFGECSHCHEPVQPHRVCKNCGYHAHILWKIPLKYALIEDI